MKDIMGPVGLSGSPSQYTYRLEDRDKKAITRKTLEVSEALFDSLRDKQARALILISESGLYKIVMRSNKPKALKFQNWVTEDVLPAIRKDGMYVQGWLHSFCAVLHIPVELIGLNFKVFLKDGQVFASSRDVAEMPPIS